MFKTFSANQVQATRRVLPLLACFIAAMCQAQGYLGSGSPVIPPPPPPILTTNLLVTTNFTTTTNLVFTTNAQTVTNASVATNFVVSTLPTISSNAVTTTQFQVQTNPVVTTQAVVTTNISIINLPPTLQSVNGQAGNWATFTQGGWGSKPSGNNPGQLLLTHFASVYPFGLEVGVSGANGNSMSFSTAVAVENYLPAGGRSERLTEDGTDATSSNAGVFGGQVTALRLNVDFAWMDKLPLTPPATSVDFGELVYKQAGDSLDGMSVVDILFAAEDALGGGSLPSGYTYSTLNDLITKLNESFDNGSAPTTWAQTSLTTLVGGGFQTNTTLTTNIVTVTNQVLTTNSVAATNWAFTTNLVSTTNLVAVTNLSLTTNLVTVSNSVVSTNFAVTTNYVVVTNGSTTGVAGGSKNFKILALTGNNIRVVDSSENSGDDRGGIALAAGRVFLRGDHFTASYAADDLSNGSRLMISHDGGRSCIGVELDALCANLATKQAYTLADVSGPLGINGGTVTRLLHLDPVTGTPTGPALQLNKPIVLTGAGLYTARIGIFSGYNEILLHDGNQVFSVDTATGEVELLGTPGSLPRMNSESWAFWGVAENFGGDRYVAYVHQDGRRVVRTRVTDGHMETIATFASLGDMASFTVDPERNRWYFHHEGPSVLVPSDNSGYEFLAYASASFEILSAAPTYTLASSHLHFREDAGTVVVSNFLAIISEPVGAPAYHFELEVDGFGMFKDLPSIDAGGHLRLTLGDDENGEAEVILAVRDERGRNLAPPQSFKITVTPVNDAPQFTLSDLAFPTPARIGYYDMGGLPGQEALAKPIEFLGHVAIPVSNLTAQALARLDVLVVFNPETSQHGVRYQTALARITDAVSRGLSLLVLDRKVADAQMILPGGKNIQFTSDTEHREVINLASRNLLTEGPAGNLDNHALDNGNSSQHGYAKSQSLPVGAEVLLTRNTADEAVMFSYSFGRGRVTYGSIPLDHFLCNSAGNAAFADVLAPNAIAYAASFAARPTLIVVNATADPVELPGLVDSINPGHWNEWDQTVTIRVTASRPELFVKGPSVDDMGTVSFQLVPGAIGETTLEFQAVDNGGTQLPGEADTSAVQRITLRILGEAQDLGFQPGGDVTVFRGEGEHNLAGWATNLRSGLAAATPATIEFIVTTDNSELFSTQPRIDAAGNLTFRTKSDALGFTTVTVVMRATAGAATPGGDDDDRSGPHNHAAQSGEVAESEAVSFRLAVAGTRVRFGSPASAVRGQLVTVPVLLDSAGPENAASATIEFDPAALTFQSSQSVGNGYQDNSLLVNNAEAAQGRLTFLAARPVGQTFGKHTGSALLNLTFLVNAASGQAQTALVFTDSITQREVATATAGATPLVVFADGSLTLTDPTAVGSARVEGDVTPRGTTDGVVTIGDVVQIARFAAGLDTITSQVELNAADCAPFATRGDGIVSVSDYVQAMRFAVGLDQPAAAQAPGGLVAASLRAMPRATATRVVRVTGALVPGQRNNLIVELVSDGAENGLGFTLAFDPAVMTFEDVRLGDDIPGLSLLANTTQASTGRVGVLLTMPLGQGLPAGTKKLVKLRVSLAAGVAAGQTPVQLVDGPTKREVADINAVVLPTTFQSLDASISADRRLRVGGGKRNANGTVELNVGAEDGQDIPDTESGKIEVFYKDSLTGPWIPLLEGVTVVGGQIKILDPANNQRALRFYQIRNRP